MKGAVERVDTRAVKKRGQSALSRGAHAGSLALQLANQFTHRKQKPRHKVMRWRN